MKGKNRPGSKKDDPDEFVRRAKLLRSAINKYWPDGNSPTRPGSPDLTQFVKKAVCHLCHSEYEHGFLGHPYTLNGPTIARDCSKCGQPVCSAKVCAEQTESTEDTYVKVCRACSAK